MQGKKSKTGTELVPISLANSSNGTKTPQNKSEFEGYAHKLISKKVYNQLQVLKKNNKGLYLKLVLFLRFPYSLVFKAEIQKKMD